MKTLNSLFAKVSDDGDIICPKCSCNIVTPKGYNPFTEKLEKYILIAYFPGQCPSQSCKAYFKVDEEQAAKHNAFWLKEEAHAEGLNGEGEKS